MRQTVFKLLSLLLPLLLLGLLEVALRAFGYGRDLGLFVKDPAHPGYLVMNQYASEKFFAQQANATIGNFEPFLEKKADNTLRIFVLGESTTIGYPYMNNGAFPRWVKYRLLQTFPGRDFEIINLSLTAVNSHTVLDFAQTIVDHQPDAVMVYTGHNEYYGAMGAASGGFQNVAFKKFVMKAREWRLVQLVSSAAAGLGSVFSGQKIDLRENLMKRLAGDQQVPYGSGTYRAGIEQFRGNMEELASLLGQRRIPLLLSTLVSNEKDLKPMVSLPGGSEVSADLHYRLGNELYQAGKFAEAKKELALARELDALRFRAPAEMNRIIRDIARRHRGVTLVDAEKLFEANSPRHILGSETLLEHVHPNLNGYAWLAEGFYTGLEKAGLVSGGAKISFTEWKKQMPLMRMDSLKGAYEVMILKEGWPFNVPMPAEEKRKKTIEEDLAGGLVVKQVTWPVAAARLQQHYLSQKDTVAALKAAEAIVLDDPFHLAGYDQAAKLSLILKNNNKAVIYLSQAFRRAPNFDRARLLFITLLKTDRPREALPYIAFAAANNPSQFNFNELKGFVEQLVAIKGRYEKDTTNIALSNQLAAGYLRFANTDAAAKYIHKSLLLEPGNAEALRMREHARTIAQ